MKNTRRAFLRSLFVAPLLVGAATFFYANRTMGPTSLGTSRLVASQPLPFEASIDSCSWEVASPLVPTAPAYQNSVAAVRAGDPSGRAPIHHLRDPYAGFSAIRVDPARNEVVIMDEFKFHIYVFDRLVKTPDSAERTEPKREIGGFKTMSRYNSDGYVDSKTGDIYIVNNDSEPGMFVYSREKSGNVAPDRGLVTPYGSF